MGERIVESITAVELRDGRRVRVWRQQADLVRAVGDRKTTREILEREGLPSIVLADTLGRLPFVNAVEVSEKRPDGTSVGVLVYPDWP